MAFDIYQFVFSPWFWLALTIVFTVVEFLTSFNLVTIWFALSALLMIFVSGLTDLLDFHLPFRVCLGLFLLISIVLLLFTRPVAIKKLRVGKAKTNVDALVGEKALVTKSIEKFGKGEVKIKGQIWTAVSEDNSAIAEGVECEVLRIEGVKAVVKPSSLKY